MTRIRNTRRTFIIGLGLFVLGVTTTTSLALWKLYRDTLANGFQLAAMHARTVEDQITQSLHVLEITTGGIAASQTGAKDATVIGQRLFDALRNAPYLRSVSLIDETGRIFASSNPANVGRRVSGDDYLPMETPNTEFLRIGRPWAGRDFASGHPAGQETRETAESFIPVLRPILGGKGHSTLLAAINTDYFINHIGRQFKDSDGRVHVLRYDGILLLSSSAEDSIGRVPTESIHTQLDEKDYGALSQTLASGDPVLSAWRASRLFPLAVVTHLNRAEVMRPWQEGLRLALVVLIPVLLAVTALALVFSRRQERLILQDAEIDRQRRMTATVFEASNDIIIITDTEAKMLSVNPAFSRVTGYSQTEAIGQNPRLLSSGMQDVAFYQAMWQQILNTGFWHGEITNRRKDGQLIVNWVTITAVHDAQGQLQHYIGVLADITERKRRELELQQAKVAAEVAAQAKTRFLATMSHEIRTPMNGIIGMTDLALMSDPGPEVRGYLELLKSSATALMGVLSDVLDYSRMEAGHVTLERIPFSVGELAQSTVALFQPQAAGKQIDLRLDIAPDVPDLAVGDPLRLRQILNNLISNAVKFTAAGEIVLHIDTEHTPTGLEYRFVVRDTGVGIPDDKLNDIFDPFVQADGSVTRTHGGSGLGLSISRQLAQLMGGRIEVASEIGRGSRFTVRLPFGNKT